ncbi:unnamed protein product, partial [Phaeothamnion confervicola]
PCLNDLGLRLSSEVVNAVTTQLDTTVTLETMWDHWFLACPPLRLLQQSNVPKSQRKRLHDLRWIMGQIEGKVKTVEGAWNASPTSLAETREMFG